MDNVVKIYFTLEKTRVSWMLQTFDDDGDSSPAYLRPQQLSTEDRIKLYENNFEILYIFVTCNLEPTLTACVLQNVVLLFD